MTVATVLLRLQDGETMLLGASERGAMDVVQWLLVDIGADPNQANDVRVHALSNQNLHAVMLNDVVMLLLPFRSEAGRR